MTRPEPSTPPDRSTSRKSTLHCPVCGHRSPAGGDWEITHNDADVGPGREQVTYTCPDCDTVVSTRSRRRAMVA